MTPSTSRNEASTPQKHPAANVARCAPSISLAVKFDTVCPFSCSHHNGPETAEKRFSSFDERRLQERGVDVLRESQGGRSPGGQLLLIVVCVEQRGVVGGPGGIPELALPVGLQTR